MLNTRLCATSVTGGSAWQAWRLHPTKRLPPSPIGVLRHRSRLTGFSRAMAAAALATKASRVTKVTRPHLILLLSALRWPGWRRRAGLLKGLTFSNFACHSRKPHASSTFYVLSRSPRHLMKILEACSRPCIRCFAILIRLPLADRHDHPVFPGYRFPPSREAITHTAVRCPLLAPRAALRFWISVLGMATSYP